MKIFSLHQKLLRAVRAVLFARVVITAFAERERADSSLLNRSPRGRIRPTPYRFLQCRRQDAVVVIRGLRRKVFKRQFAVRITDATCPNLSANVGHFIQ
jgi:hypothetical protein